MKADRRRLVYLRRAHPKARVELVIAPIGRGPDVAAPQVIKLTRSQLEGLIARGTRYRFGETR